VRRSYRHTLSAALLVAVWIASPALSALHHAFEQHSYCPEHGTLEEQRDDVAEPAARAPVAAETGLSSAVFAADRGQSALGHEVCAHQEFAPRDAFSPEHAVAVEPAPLARTADRSPNESIAGRPIPLLHAAPKCSPPRAA
jgi:hypothetical protein